MIFLNSASSAAVLVIYLPGVCTNTDTERKERKARVQSILKPSRKKNTLYMMCCARESYIYKAKHQNTTENGQNQHKIKGKIRLNSNCNFWFPSFLNFFSRYDIYLYKKRQNQNTIFVGREFNFKYIYVICTST